MTNGAVASSAFACLCPKVLYMSVILHYSVLSAFISQRVWLLTVHHPNICATAVMATAHANTTQELLPESSSTIRRILLLIRKLERML